MADGVYALVGTADDIAPANGGRVGNSGFIVGRHSVTVVDAGVSHAHGEEILAAIRRVTPLPLGRLVLTHAVQEFIYGTTALAAAGASPLCHSQSAALMRRRCEHCLAGLRAELGATVMAGTRLMVPDDTVDGSLTFDADGRVLELIHPGWAATPGDLMVLDRSTGTLFAGGVLIHGRVPEIRDGRLEAWIRVVDDLARRTDLRVVVPGHGPPMEAAAIARTADYLRALDRRVRALMDRGASLMEAIEDGAVEGFAGWSGLDTVHRRNVQLRYLELEAAEMDRP